MRKLWRNSQSGSVLPKTSFFRLPPVPPARLNPSQGFWPFMKRQKGPPGSWTMMTCRFSPPEFFAAVPLSAACGRSGLTGSMWTRPRISPHPNMRCSACSRPWERGCSSSGMKTRAFMVSAEHPRRNFSVLPKAFPGRRSGRWKKISAPARRFLPAAAASSEAVPNATTKSCVPPGNGEDGSSRCPPPPWRTPFARLPPSSPKSPPDKLSASSTATLL